MDSDHTGGLGHRISEMACDRVSAKKSGDESEDAEKMVWKMIQRGVSIIWVKGVVFP